MVKRLVGGWQVLANTVFQSGAPMGVPSSVWVLGDPHLENPTWDRLFKTGYIDANGVVRNVLAGEQPVFAVRPPNSLADHAGALGKSARSMGHHLRCLGHQEHAHPGRHELPVPVRGLQRVEHARIFRRPKPDADFDELRQDHPRQRAEQRGAESSNSDSVSCFRSDRESSMNRRNFVQNAVAGALASAATSSQAAPRRIQDDRHTSGRSLVCR